MTARLNTCFRSTGRGPDINIRHLRAFDAAARLESLNQASEAVHMSQSSVVYAVNRVEQMFGTPLLQRGSSGSRVTPAGELVSRRLSAFFRLFEAAVAATLMQAQLSKEHECVRLTGALTWQHMLAVVGIARLTQARLVATALGVSASAILTRLRDTERLFGCVLFERRDNQILLKPAGQVLAEGLSQALRELDYAMDDLAAHVETARPTIAIGCLGFARLVLIPLAISNSPAKESSLVLRVIDDTFPVMAAKLRAGELDYLICTKKAGVDTRGLEAENLFQTRFAVACRRSHPLATARRVLVEDLARFEWILPLPQTPLRLACDEVFKDTGLPNGISVETRSAALSFAMLRSSDRLMIVSEHEMQAGGNGTDLVALPFSLPIPPREVVIYRREAFFAPPHHARFLDHLRAVAATLSLPGCSAGDASAA
ncbi:LysR family transcriptional regulator [Devosia sp. 919]|uniref:LysR family transcriptional regulator n=1 Tax=Devosia sp. 919 TaxID=2726065 RepID=UPI0015572B1C|nr:LysR family transcriptional regulator [Devosia sp. 919]